MSSRYDELKQLVNRLQDEPLKQQMLREIQELEDADYNSWCEKRERE